MYTCRSNSEPYPRENQRAGPTVEQLFDYATEQIRLAASDSWPCELIRLAEHVPSVTGYVRRVEVSGRTLFAKYSYSGTSLVSVLRGRYGDWDQLRAAQLAYVVAPGSLLQREAAQLRLLHRLGRPRTHRVAAFHHGVLFTELVPGITLAQLLCAEPWRASELLERTWAELRELHCPGVAQRFSRSVAIEERSVAGTFARKFTGIGASVYLDQLAAECRDDPELWATLRRVVTRLGRLWAAAPVAAAPVLVYGDLKPEHVVFEHHAISSDRPVFIDPGMSHAPVTVDAAKLVSRVILLLIGFQPPGIEVIGDGLGVFVNDQAQALSAVAGREWLRELLLLWLMDTVNILTTYLSAPAGLPLPWHAKAVLCQARTVSALVERVSGELAAGTDPLIIWHHGLVDAIDYTRLPTTA